MPSKLIPESDLPSFAQLTPEESDFFNTRGEPVGGEPAREEPEVVEPAVETEAEPETVEVDEPPLDERTAAEISADEELARQAAEEAAQLETPPEPPKRVARTAPIPVLQAERERRQNAERENQALRTEVNQRREWQARIDERLRMLNEQNQRAQQPVPPDPNEDPEAYRAYVEQQREAHYAQLEERLARVEAGNTNNGLATSVAASTTQFRAATPDYDQVVGGLRAALHAELEAGGYEDPNERGALINAWSDPIIRRALERGVNPAEAIYRVGRARLGSVTASPANPSRTAVAPPTNAGRVANIRRGTVATRSLTRPDTRDMADGLTLDKLLNASPTEFARHMAENPAAVAALMGR